VHVALRRAEILITREFRIARAGAPLIARWEQDVWFRGARVRYASAASLHDLAIGDFDNPSLISVAL
jgi:hypothetical protein